MPDRPTSHVRGARVLPRRAGARSGCEAAAAFALHGRWPSGARCRRGRRRRPARRRDRRRAHALLGRLPRRRRGSGRHRARLPRPRRRAPRAGGGRRREAPTASFRSRREKRRRWCVSVKCARACPWSAVRLRSRSARRETSRSFRAATEQRSARRSTAAGSTACRPRCGARTPRRGARPHARARAGGLRRARRCPFRLESRSSPAGRARWGVASADRRRERRDPRRRRHDLLHRRHGHGLRARPALLGARDLSRRLHTRARPLLRQRRRGPRRPDRADLLGRPARHHRDYGHLQPDGALRRLRRLGRASRHLSDQRQRGFPRHPVQQQLRGGQRLPPHRFG